ncbi:cytochrome P450 CYP736A12-like [Punica granatum]|uniref:Cytochrome P450 CYP736A12-like n=1 Tax=Punica granatum TaxID=22663 RepID=A0A6P8BV92_PUNGR|nr:cytochrome P450 CYP736A12-like [Punica granatum]
MALLTRWSDPVRSGLVPGDIAPSGGGTTVAAAVLRLFQRAEKQPPGPWPLPVIWNLHVLGKLPHQSLRKLAKGYGPIMCLRVGNVPAIVVSSPEAAKLFLQTHDRIVAGHPKTHATDHIFYRGKGIALIDYGPHRQSVRRLCISQLLSPSKINLFGPVRKEELRHLVRKIKEAAAVREVMDLSAAVGQLIGDVAFRMILGGSSYKDTANSRAMIREGLTLVGAFNLADYVPLLRAFALRILNFVYL